MVRCEVERCGAVWCSKVQWFGVAWCDVMQCNGILWYCGISCALVRHVPMVCCSEVCMVRCSKVHCGMVCFGTSFCSVVRGVVVWCGMVGCATVLCSAMSVVWYGAM